MREPGGSGRGYLGEARGKAGSTGGRARGCRGWRTGDKRLSSTATSVQRAAGRTRPTAAGCCPHRAQPLATKVWGERGRPPQLTHGSRLPAPRASLLIRPTCLKPPPGVRPPFQSPGDPSLCLCPAALTRECPLGPRSPVVSAPTMTPVNPGPVCLIAACTPACPWPPGHLNASPTERRPTALASPSPSSPDHPALNWKQH